MRRLQPIAWVLCLILICPINAFALPEEVEDALPPEARELLESTAQSEGGVPDLAEGLVNLWNTLCGQIGTLFRRNIGGAVTLLGIVLLCSLAEDCCKAGDGSRVLPVVPAAGAAAITMTAVGDLQSMMGVGVDAIEQLAVFSKALLPTLMAAVAAGGGAVSAGMRHVAAVFVTDVLITLIRELLLPLVYVYAATSAAAAFVAGKRLGSIAKAIRKGTGWLLSGILVLYTGYLTLAGAAASSADRLALQVTKTAMGALPVVGSIISQAADTVVSGASLLKSTVGIAGTLAVLAMCLMPVLDLAIQYLLYKVTAFLSSTLGSEELVELIDNLGGAFGLILGMTGTCATLLLISTITSIMVVTG